MIPNDLNLNKISKIHKLLSPYVVETPLIEGSTLVNDILKTNIIFKLEFLQNAGTFKARGATYNVLQLNELQKTKGVTAVSAGNHAIAVSYVANKFNLKNKIFIYNSANAFRINKCKELKANINFADPQNAFNQVELASKNEGYYFIHPFDGVPTLQGTASLGYEISTQIKDFDNIIVSVGGGGLISGIASAIKQFNSNCKIIGVEPEGAQGMSQSLKENMPLKKVSINTIADSLAAPLHMPYSFSICQQTVDQMIQVSDRELVNAMKFMFENCKMILEPACVAGIAALMGPLKNKFINQKTLVLLCGSNIDSDSWSKLVL